MKEQLAERLLAKVMKWRPDDIAAERPILQALARYKYDEYQQFSAGQKFIESLALWLDCMSQDHRKEAYDFVRRRLIFFSSAEVRHFVATAYPYYIKPKLIHNFSTIGGYSLDEMRSLKNSTDFKAYETATLFLGLSDGAKTDIFRRANEGIITHEQVLQSYEIRAKRVDKLLSKLRSRLKNILGKEEAESRFKTVVLLDDFSASGTSYLREEESGALDGKLNELANDFSEGEVSKLIELSEVHFVLVLYVATAQAVDHLTILSEKIPLFKNSKLQIKVVHPLPNDIRIQEGDRLDGLLTAHYDPSVEDEHTRKGGIGVKYGYAGCGLPVILSHNTPNNSIFPLWCKSPTLRPLFPRSIRHKAL